MNEMIENMANELPPEMKNRLMEMMLDRAVGNFKNLSHESQQKLESVVTEMVMEGNAKLKELHEKVAMFEGHLLTIEAHKESHENS